MTIVIAYGTDQYGRAALAHGAAQAELRREDLVVVNATRGDSLVDRRYADDAEIDRIKAELQTLGLAVSIRHDVVPDVADAVIEVAEQVKATLVVVGVKHRSPVGKALLGSIAQRVILDATCPVLAVKPDPLADTV